MRAHKLLGLSAVLLCVAAAPAPQASSQVASNDSQAAPAVSGGSQAQAQQAEEKKICKLLPSSGTRFAKKACLTAKEWKQVEAEVEE
jgi:hypothetical protein